MKYIIRDCQGRIQTKITEGAIFINNLIFKTIILKTHYTYSQIANHNIHNIMVNGANNSIISILMIRINVDIDRFVNGGRLLVVRVEGGASDLRAYCVALLVDHDD